MVALVRRDGLDSMEITVGSGRRNHGMNPAN